MQIINKTENYTVFKVQEHTINKLEVCNFCEVKENSS